MQPDVDALRAELADLRAEVAELRTQPATPQRISRRHLITGLAGLGAAGAAGIATATPAAAADGDPLILGANNESFNGTSLSTSAGNPTLEVLGGDETALAVRGLTGVSIDVEDFGIKIHSHLVGVESVCDGHSAFMAWALEGAAGFQAHSEQGPAIHATSDSGVPLVLAPMATADGPPNGPGPEAGSFFLDASCTVWLCVEGGATPVWTRLLREDTASGRMVPIAPIRTIDTRAPGGRPAGSPAIPGQKAGPLKGGTSVTLDLAGIDAIPATATGVVGNLTVAGPSYTGYLVARPSGAASTTSSLNFPKGVTAIANAFTSQLGPAGLTITASGTTPNTYHLIVDITAYIT